MTIGNDNINKLIAEKHRLICECDKKHISEQECDERVNKIQQQIDLMNRDILNVEYAKLSNPAGN